ncbi:M3 family oligoendopeptidase [Thermaerobacter subterraneus]|uniref:Oligoendopeptidase, pepF/M3 family n=1 Tax=Thermaerobacter subterraneus DSM 13965 TaxID=867903 RepID=K6NYS9_9FIRM|nr:M3 family oligoendopeptidase [Thermaerobacter subterraneus]EKP93995.1 oligoendopeptidase, pepF/M3 family [Thermaerobacter subterraneus DSM 13965]
MAVSSRYNPTWDLETFFPGGSASPQFESFLASLAQDLDRLRQEVRRLDPGAPAAHWENLVNGLQDAGARLGQAGAFTYCLVSQDTTDERARLLLTRVGELRATYNNLWTDLDRHLLAVSDPAWQALLEHPGLREVAFALDERRRRARERMSPELESLAGSLAVDGYHAWGDLYELVAGRIRVPVQEGDRTVHLSVGQAANRLEDPDRAVRAAVFDRWEAAWGQEAEVIAAALNHLAGFRWQWYRRRGWDDILKEPLDENRMQRATLEAMWDAVARKRGALLEYFRWKAERLGVQRLAWFDAHVPVYQAQGKVTYDEAADFVIEQFARFSDELAGLARRAFSERWIEAEDRPNKRAGGFCTGFPLSRQSRIFMTFGGTASNVGTLAHELGHAYHQWLMDDLPVLARDYPMSLAETASTFAERVVTDAAIRHAPDTDTRLAFLEQQVLDGVAFCMNIHARFLFETAFYEARRQGPLSVADLNGLMEDAQRRAYHDSLDRYHPYFWASKLHFYATDAPFYNFPYTFGFLFSSGLYARARAEGPSFARRYAALLQDTGRMTVEDLARRHLGVDLTGPAFWEEALDAALAPLDEFLQLARAAGSGK